MQIIELFDYFVNSIHIKFYGMNKGALIPIEVKYGWSNY